VRTIVAEVIPPRATAGPPAEVAQKRRTGFGFFLTLVIRVIPLRLAGRPCKSIVRRAARVPVPQAEIGGRKSECRWCCASKHPPTKGIAGALRADGPGISIRPPNLYEGGPNRRKDPGAPHPKGLLLNEAMWCLRGGGRCNQPVESVDPDPPSAKEAPPPQSP